MPLLLRDNLHCCLCGGRAIFLDIETGRYFSLSEPLNAIFKSLWFDGAPGLAHEEGLASLVSQGILRTAVAEDTRISDAALPSPETELVIGPKYPIALWISVIVSQIVARIAVRRKRFASIIKGIEARNARHDGSSIMDQQQRLRAIAAAFKATDRVISPKDRCLTRSLAFLWVCNRYGIFPTLVIGVRTNPFTAHCWLQADGCVLSGDYEQARYFVPILAVP